MRLVLRSAFHAADAEYSASELFYFVAIGEFEIAFFGVFIIPSRPALEKRETRLHRGFVVLERLCEVDPIGADSILFQFLSEFSDGILHLFGIERDNRFTQEPMHRAGIPQVHRDGVELPAQVVEEAANLGAKDTIAAHLVFECHAGWRFPELLAERLPGDLLVHKFSVAIQSMLIDETLYLSEVGVDGFR